MKYPQSYTPEVISSLRVYEFIYGHPRISGSCVTDECANQIGGYLPVFYEAGIDQNGGYLPVFYEYGIDQNGDGLWGNIWNFFKPFVVPLFKSGAKATAETVLNSAGGYINDIVDGADWRKAGKERLNEVGSELTSKLVNKVKRNMMGRGKRRLAIEDISDTPAEKVRKIIEEIEQQEDKRQGPQKKLFSILPPPEKKGRDLRIKKRVVKKKFRKAKVKALKKIQKGKGFECWL
jgi:hypothetical protein